MKGGQKLPVHIPFIPLHNVASWTNPGKVTVFGQLDATPSVVL
jgi:hypothetical protein